MHFCSRALLLPGQRVSGFGFPVDRDCCESPVGQGGSCRFGSVRKMGLESALFGPSSVAYIEAYGTNPPTLTARREPE
jgi:hypothetical protein